MKNYRIEILLMVCSMILFTLNGCCKGDHYYYGAVDPDGNPLVNPGELIVTPPIGATDGTFLPTASTEVIIIWPNNKTQTIKPNTVVDVEQGTYQVIVLTNADGTPVTGETSDKLKVEGKTVYLTPNMDGKIEQASEVYASYQTITVQKGVLAIVDLPQSPLTRQVEVEVLLQGLSQTDLNNVTLSLHGVSATRNIDTPFTDIRAILQGNYVEAVSREMNANGTIAFPMRLLGVNTTQSQALKVNITTQFGVSTEVVEDVTALLANFNFGAAKIPVKIGLTISFGINGVTSTITDWSDGVDEDIKGE